MGHAGGRKRGIPSLESLGRFALKGFTYRQLVVESSPAETSLISVSNFVRFFRHNIPVDSDPSLRDSMQTQLTLTVAGLGPKQN